MSEMWHVCSEVQSSGPMCQLLLPALSVLDRGTSPPVASRDSCTAMGSDTGADKALGFPGHQDLSEE